MEHSVDQNARDIEGWTPLHAAAATGNIQMINLLVNEGASLVAINNDNKMPTDVAADGDVRYILQQKMIEAGERGRGTAKGLVDWHGDWRQELLRHHHQSLGGVCIRVDHTFPLCPS